MIRLLIIFLVLTVNGFSQKSLSGDYLLACCKGDFYEKLSLNKDSTFSYSFSFHRGDENNNGKWTVNKDTLILYAYKNGKPKSDTLKAEESIIDLKDSIEITFMTTIGDKRTLCFPDFSVNGKCLNTRPTAEGKYIIPKQQIKFIATKRNQVYFVKNPNANKFIIIYPLRLDITSHLVNIEKSVIKDNCIIPVDCDMLDTGHKLEKK